MIYRRQSSRLGEANRIVKGIAARERERADIKFFVAFRLIAINYPTVNVCSEAEANALALANQMGGGIDLPLEKSRRES